MSNLKAGFCRIAVNPPLGIHVVGLYEERVAKEILDEIAVTAVAFDDGIKKAVVMSVDHLHIFTREANVYRKMISEYCNLPLEAIFMHCTHTHGGPAIGPSDEPSYQGIPAYDEMFGLALRDCAYNALQDLKPAALSTSAGEIHDISFIRRYFMKDGSVRTNPPIGHPDIAGPVSKTNDTVNLVKIERENAETILIVNFGVHPCSHAVEAITADYPYFVRTTLEKALDNTKCMFLTAFQGDVGCTDRRPLKGDWDVRAGYKRTQHIGRAIAGAVLQICTLTQPVENTTIAYAQDIIHLPSFQENDKLEEAKKIYALYLEGRTDEIMAGDGTRDNIPGGDMEKTIVIAEAARRVKLEHGPEFFDQLASAVRIGDIVFAGLPGEPFTDIGVRVLDKSDYQMTVLCCTVNGGSTYYPTSIAYEQGGYESRTSYLRKGADDILVDRLSALIQSLKD